MKILYAEDDEDLRELFVMKMESVADMEITECESGNQAIEVLRENQDFDVIISDFNMDDGNGEELYTYIKEQKINKPFILFSPEDIRQLEVFKNFLEDHTGNGQIDKPPLEGTLEKALENAMKSHREEGAAEEEQVGPLLPPSKQEGYVGIRPKMFLKIRSCPADVFVKLSENKYVKIINKDEKFEKEIIQKFINKGVQRLYIERVHQASFADFMVDSLVNALKEAGDKSASEAKDVQVDAHQFVQDQLLSIGLNKTVIEVTKTTIDTTVKVMEHSPVLSDLLSGMKKDTDYIYEHSLMVSYIACAIAGQMDWESKDTKMKLTMASFMHDITLNDHQLAKISDLKNIDSDDYDDDDLQEVKQHPLEAAKIISKLTDDFPPDIDTIVAQHHEMPNGSGFPRGLSHTNINPLSCVFILAHLCRKIVEAHDGKLELIPESPNTKFVVMVPING